ncbi:MAG: hypothetical protein C5B54_09040 [Acidobacteria bacterium]|nr:MAG: hypothetical protein C5B54_09040 [Acidobacteriota bacterium]
MIAGGLFISSTSVITALRSMPSDLHLQQQLLQGATIFRTCVILLGVLFIVFCRSGSQTRPPDSTPESKAGTAFATLLILLIIATALRLYDLGAGLWHDEILTYVSYVKLPIGEIITTFHDQNQHFLFTILAHACIKLFGHTNWALRLPAVFFGVCSIAALFYFGRLVTSEIESLFATALMTFSYHHIWFSQNARGYTGLLFFTILSSYFLLRAIREPADRWWILYACSAALGMFTNFTILFIIAGHFFLFLRKSSKLRGFLLGFALAGFLTILLHALALPQILGGGIGEVSTVPLWKKPFWTILEFVNALRIGFAGIAIAACAVIVFAIGVVSYLWSAPEVAELLFVPSFLCAAVVIGMGHHLWPRFFFFGFGFASLIAVRGTMKVGEHLSKYLNVAGSEASRISHPASRIGVLFCSALVLVSAFSIPRVYGPKQDFESALHYIDENAKPGDVVVTVGLAGMTYQNFYGMDWENVKTINDLNCIRKQHQRTWLLYTFEPELQSVYPQILSSIRNDFHIQKEFYGTVGSGTVVVCRSDHPPF